MWLAVIIGVSLLVEVLSYITGGEPAMDSNAQTTFNTTETSLK